MYLIYLFSNALFRACKICSHEIMVHSQKPFLSKKNILITMVILVLSGFGAEWARRRRQRVNALSARNYLYERTKSLLNQKIILKMAAAQQDLGPGNTALNDCLASPPSPCTVWNPESQLPFGLRSGLDLGSPMIVGTKDHPAVYNAAGGQDCTHNDPACPAWSIEAWFWAECPNNLRPTKDSPCTSEPHIFVRHRVIGLNNLRSESNQPEAYYFHSSMVAGAFQVGGSHESSPSLE